MLLLIILKPLVFAVSNVSALDCSTGKQRYMQYILMHQLNKQTLALVAGFSSLLYCEHVKRKGKYPCKIKTLTDLDYLRSSIPYVGAALTRNCFPKVYRGKCSDCCVGGSMHQSCYLLMRLLDLMLTRETKNPCSVEHKEYTRMIIKNPLLPSETTQWYVN